MSEFLYKKIKKKEKMEGKKKKGEKRFIAFSFDNKPLRLLQLLGL